MTEYPRHFQLCRDTDVSGVSGTGHVADGVVFSDGHAAVHWLGRWPTTTPHPEGLASVEGVHGHGGATRIVFLDEQPAAAPAQAGLQNPSYEAVFAYIRNEPHDFLPRTIVERNAMIWGAVHAALDAARPGPAEHCGDQPSEAFTWIHPGQYSECVLRPGHQGSHADQHGMRWWLTTGPVTTHPYQGDGHLHPCTQPGPGICGRPEYDHEPITTEG
ncbi:hypothetical protein ACIQRW_34130 [Streptomyces sp. NPDC091287]|uniref:hypothetical protein n=1 Tax=Streptomyces sp. NPDC091287 TaxID=3365988 RepID=UPI0038045A41